MKTIQFKNLFLALSLLIVFLFTAAPFASAENHETYNIKGVAFEIPLKLSSANDAGLDAVSFFYPNNAESGKEKFEILLVFLNKEMIEAMEMNEEELLQYVKTTYIGSAQEAEKKIERKALGETVIGEWQMTDIPRNAVFEIYLIPLKDGSKLSAAFRTYEPMDQKESEKVIKAFFETLTEK